MELENCHIDCIVNELYRRGLPFVFAYQLRPGNNVFDGRGDSPLIIGLATLLSGFIYDKGLTTLKDNENK